MHDVQHFKTAKCLTALDVNLNVGAADATGFPCISLIQHTQLHTYYMCLTSTPWPHFIIDVGLVQRGYSIPSPVLLKCCVASVVA